MPAITVTPGQGPHGAKVVVAGTGFSVSTPLASLVFDSVTILVASCTSGSLTSDASGAFTCTFAVPAATSGTTVTATDAGGRTGTGTFTVTVPAITLSPVQGPTGISTVATGTGFSPSVTVALTISAGGTLTGSCSATVASDGTFTCSSVAVSGVAAAYTITATGSDIAAVPNDTAGTTFTITTPAITLSPV
ncbi:MAG: hypothetical protein ACREBT_04790, partial [Thermoplasmata archaeon]